jgi:hypothetical protein
MGLEPSYLADRAGQLDRFARYLAGFPGLPRNVRLTGLRGVGKTVLLHRYAAMAETAGWLVVQRECSEHLQDEASFGQALVEDCRRAVEASSRGLALKHRSQAVVTKALSLLGSFTISLAGVTMAVRPPALRARPLLFEDQIFAALEVACSSAAAAGRPGVLLCYDEAHLLRDTSSNRQFPLGLFLAALAQAQRQGLSAMLIVCGLPTLTDNLARAKSYSERMFQAEELTALSPPEDLLAFTRPLELAGRRYEPGLAAKVREETGGYPFAIQFFGALLWDAVEWPAGITLANLAQHRSAIVDGLDNAFFHARLARTSRAERGLLAAVAASGESAQVQEVLRRAGLPNRTAQQMIARLRDKGLLYRPERGCLAFTVPLLGDYLRRSSEGG